jgi:thiosulfate dehydrogenase (quinone) large subunit
MSDKAIAYLLLRVTLGIDLFIHGVSRLLGDYAGFVEKTLEDFHNTIMPHFLLVLFGWSLPLLETLVGFLLLLGLFTRFAAILGAFLIAILVFGTGLQQNWNVVGIQLIYALIYYFIILNLQYDRYSIDHWISNKSA